MNSYIPKIVHYCWFGEKKIPHKYIKYICEWKRLLPNYKFILWNEDNFDIRCTKYSEQAYEVGKYAFVSDVARMYALNRFGGIYLDTDVEMIKSPEELLKEYSVVLGSENVEENTIGTGFIASIKDSMITNLMLEYYRGHDFINDDGQFNTLANTSIIASFIKQKYFLEPSREIISNQDIIIYPKEYFTAFDNEICKPEITDNTYCIHHFADSWTNFEGKIKRKIKIIISRVYNLGRKK